MSCDQPGQAIGITVPGQAVAIELLPQAQVQADASAKDVGDLDVATLS